MTKEWLLGKTLDELRQVAVEAGLPAFVGNQLAQWLYPKRATTWEAMHNLSKKARETLSQRYEPGGFAPHQVQTSADGTRKYLFPTLSPRAAQAGIEAVMIPDEDRATLCISSQAGCGMGCRFCMTGGMGMLAQLSAGEIVGQVLRVDESSRLTNLVYMGMGEPLNNWEAVKKSIEILTAPWGLAWSPRRITLSTVGILPIVPKLLEETQVHVALSLHNPLPEERARLMPAERTHPSHQVLDLLRREDFRGQRRVSFEYILFDRWNDSPAHAKALIRLLREGKGSLAREGLVNLIRFHAFEGFPLQSVREERLLAFERILRQAGLRVTVRASRGMDILAACGMLSTQEKATQEKAAREQATREQSVPTA